MPVEQHYVSELLFLIFFSCLVDRVIMTSPIPTTMAQTAPPVDPIIIWRKAEEWLPSSNRASMAVSRESMETSAAHPIAPPLGLPVSLKSMPVRVTDQKIPCD